MRKARTIAFNATIALASVFAAVIMLIIIPFSNGTPEILWNTAIIALNFLNFGWCVHDIVVAIDEG